MISIKRTVGCALLVATTISAGAATLSAAERYYVAD